MPRKVREDFLNGFVRFLSLAGASGWRQVTPTWDEITRSVGGAVCEMKGFHCAHCQRGQFRRAFSPTSARLPGMRVITVPSTAAVGEWGVPTRRDDGW